MTEYSKNSGCCLPVKLAEHERTDIEKPDAKYKLTIRLWHSFSCKKRKTMKTLFEIFNDAFKVVCNPVLYGASFEFSEKYCQNKCKKDRDNHTFTVECSVVEIKKCFLLILCCFFPTKFFARTLKSSSVETTDVLRPIYIGSEHTPTLQVVHWVYIFPSKIERHLTATDLPQNTSIKQFETSLW